MVFQTWIERKSKSFGEFFGILFYSLEQNWIDDWILLKLLFKNMYFYLYFLQALVLFNGGGQLDYVRESILEIS